MNNNPLFFIIIACGISLQSNAQSKFQYSIIPSGSLVYQYQEVDKTGVGTNSTEKITDFGFDLNWPALQIKAENGNFHELGIEQLYVKQNDAPVISQNSGTSLIGGAKVLSSGIGFLYGYSVQLFKSQDESIRVYIGPTLRLNNNTHKETPYTSNVFPVFRINTSLDIAVSPRLQADLNEHWFVDFSIPVSIGFLSHEHINISNPNFSAREQSTGSFGLEYFKNRVECKIGVGYQLNYKK